MNGDWNKGIGVTVTCPLNPVFDSSSDSEFSESARVFQQDGILLLYLPDS